MTRPSRPEQAAREGVCLRHEAMSDHAAERVPPLQTRLGGAAFRGPVKRPQVLSGDPGMGDLLVDLPGLQPAEQPVPDPLGEVLAPPGEGVLRRSTSCLAAAPDDRSCCVGAALRCRAPMSLPTPVVYWPWRVACGR